MSVLFNPVVVAQLVRSVEASTVHVSGNQVEVCEAIYACVVMKATP